MSKACHLLHQWANGLQKYAYGFDTQNFPENGIYLVFEKGEQAHGVNRIVRVGTHDGNGRLGKRIFEHLYKPNKDRSIFRKHVGRCLLADSDFLEYWNLDLTKKSEREKYQSVINFERMAEVEKQVGTYISGNFSFSVFEVKTKKERLNIEKLLLSTITACSGCSPSKAWLGLNHQNPRIRQGLWNVQGLSGDVLSEDEMKNLIKMYS